MVAGQQGMSCVAVAGQQYIALGGNQIVQVAPGVSGSGEVGGSEGSVVVNGDGVTVGVADTSREENKTSGDPGGEERNTTPPALSDTRKDAQLITMEEESQPVATQGGTPLSAPSPVSTMAHEEREERGGDGGGGGGGGGEGGGGGGGGSKLSESEAIQTVVNPAQVHSPQQQQQQQESEVSALNTHNILHWLHLCVHTVSAYLLYLYCTKRI